MENCTHEKIVSLRDAETQLPVMWMCTDCRLKFVPITQAAVEVSLEREACARLCDDGTEQGAQYATAIRARR